MGPSADIEITLKRPKNTQIYILCLFVIVQIVPSEIVGNRNYRIICVLKKEKLSEHFVKLKA